MIGLAVKNRYLFNISISYSLHSVKRSCFLSSTRTLLILTSESYSGFSFLSFPLVTARSTLSSTAFNCSSSFSLSSSMIMSASLTGLTSPSTWVISSLSNAPAKFRPFQSSVHCTVTAYFYSGEITALTEHKEYRITCADMWKKGIS